MHSDHAVYLLPGHGPAVLFWRQGAFGLSVTRIYVLRLFGGLYR